jgi:sigma-B regulation protein RsbU (phosphoserine phosphatase)
VEDVTHEPNFRPNPGLPETRSEVSLPLRVKDNILGVLDIQSNQWEGLNQFDLVALRILADNIAMALEATRTQEELKQKSDQIAAVLDTTRIFSSILDTELLLEKVISLIQEKFGYPIVHLFTLQPFRKQLAYQTGSGPRSKNPEQSQSVFDLQDPVGIIAHVARTGRSLIVNDVTREPLYRPAAIMPEITQSELTVPLKFGDEILGVLDIQSNKLNAFNSQDQSLMEALASSLAITLRNSRLYQSEKWRRRVAESFQHVASLLSTNIAVDQLFNIILTELEKLLPCDASAIWLTNFPPDGNGEGTFRLVASHGVSKDVLDDTYRSSPQIQKFLSKVFEAQRPILRKPNDPYGPLGDACEFPGDYSSIATPLLAGDEVMGVLTLAHRSPDRYGLEASSMTEIFASYSAAAIQNARLYNRAQEQALISTILLQVAEAARQENNLDELLTTLTRIIPLLAGVNGSMIFYPAIHNWILIWHFQVFEDYLTAAKHN